MFSKPCLSTNSVTSKRTRSRTFSSRTTPPLPTFLGPASNWGLTKITRTAGPWSLGAVRPERISAIFGISFLTEMNDTSITTTSIGSVILEMSKCLKFSRSKFTTRGSFLIFQWSCPYPTSTQNTFLAPFCKRQSVNPPVEAPTSRQTLSVMLTSNSRKAFSSLSPPRLTKGMTSLMTTSTSSAKTAPALSATTPFTKTCRAMMSACALARDSTRSFFTNSWSRRDLVFFSTTMTVPLRAPKNHLQQFVIVSQVLVMPNVVPYLTKLVLCLLTCYYSINIVSLYMPRKVKELIKE